MDREFSEKTIQHVSKKLDADIDELKNYINTYSLLPVLEKAFINDNFIYEKQKGVPNEDFLISDYIADLYLSFQINRETKEPLQDDVNRIFEICMDIISSSMTIEILSFTEFGKFTNPNVLFKYTERTVFVPLIERIIYSILDKKYLDIFYDKTGFYLTDISFFRFALINFVYDKYEKQSSVKNILSFTKEELFSYIESRSKIEFSADRLEKIINYFEILSSNNTDYLLRADNPVKRKPIFKYKNKYICCNPLRLVKNTLQIFEDEIKKDEKLLSEYGNSKGQKFEELIYIIIKSLFPSSTIYHGLTYFTKDKIKHETDIIVDTGNYLLVIEAKGRTFQEKGKQGNEGSYKRSIKNIIRDAHEQCKTTYEFIMNNENAEFYNEKDKIEISKNNYLDIYLVTVELENLDAITSDLYETVEIYEKNPILTFSMYDLYMIFDLLEKGSLFLIYLEQRRETLKQKNIHTSTELDYLSTFLIRDLIFDKKHGFEEPFDLISLSNVSTDIDNYYLNGKKKPVRKMSVGANIFLKQLNDCDGKIGLTIEKEFLSASIKTQKDILSRIQKLKKLATRGKSSVYSYTLESNKIGISLICYKNDTFISNLNIIKDYVEEKMYEFNIRHWAFIGFTLKPNKIQVLHYI